MSIRTLPSAVALAAALLPALSFAQGVSTVPDSVFASVWTRVMRDFAGDLARTPAADRQAVYERIVDRVMSDAEIARIRDTPGYRNALVEIVREMPDSALAQSVNAPLTNPGSNQLVERSGFTELVALAADARKLFSADDSAVSVNLNAVALFGGGKAGDRSAQYLYARRELWRRIGGTVTFGGKVPEKAITGISGVPSAETLFDALSWDVKVRLIGDRDPRASRWYPLLVGELGDDVELAARIVAMPDVPLEDVAALRAAATRVVGRQLAAARDRIARSLQVSVKFAGQHLTEQTGRNKYSGAVMLDKGFGGGVDVTANVSYSAADAQQASASPFRTREWQFAAGVTGSVLKDAIARGRAVELTAAASGRLPMDAAAVAIERKRVLQANVSVSLPFQASAKIPLSLTWSNDPNNLVKQNFVSGQVGVSYDFGSIWKLLQ